MADDASADDLNEWLGIKPKVSADGPPPPPPGSSLEPPPLPPLQATGIRATTQTDRLRNVADSVKHGEFGDAWDSLYSTLPSPVQRATEAAGNLVVGSVTAPAAVLASAINEGPREAVEEHFLRPAQAEYEKAYDPRRGVLERVAHGIAGTVPMLGPALAESSEVKPAYEGEPLTDQLARASVGWVAGILGGKELAKHLGGESAQAGRQFARDLAEKHGLPPAVPAERTLLAPKPEAVPDAAVNAGESIIQDAVAEGRALAPDVQPAVAKFRAEKEARGGEPLDYYKEVPKEQVRDELTTTLGWDRARVAKATPAEAAKALEAVGVKVSEAPSAPKAPETSFDEILSHIPEEPPAEPLAPTQREKADTAAASLLHGMGDEAIDIPRKELLEHLEGTHGKEATPQFLDRVMQRVRDGITGRKYQEEYDKIQPPADLQQRPPDFARDGVKQWVAAFDAYGREMHAPEYLNQESGAANTPTHVVSWAEDPTTGELVNAGGITNLHGEQHFLTHTRRLGLHDLPTSFSPIKKLAESLGWEEATPDTSSPMAQEMYARYHSRREGRANEISAQGVAAPGGDSAEAAQGRALPGSEGDRTAGAGVPEALAGEGTPGSPDLSGAYPGHSGEVNRGGGAVPPPADAAAPPTPGSLSGRAAASAPAYASASSETPVAGSSALAPDLSPALESSPAASQAASPASAARPSPGETGGPPGPPSPLGGPPPAPGTPSAYEPRFKNSLDQRVHDAVRQVMAERGITLDRVRWPRVTDQVISQLASGEIPAAAVKQMWQQHGISELEGLRSLGEGTKVAAQILNRRSQLARLFGEGAEGRAGTRDVLNQAVDIQGFGAHGWEWAYDMATHSTRGMVKLLFTGASTLSHAAGGGLIRTGLGGLIDTVDLAWHKTLGIEYAPSLRPRPFDSLKAMSNAITGWAGTDAFKSKALGGGVHFLPDKWRAEAAEMRRSVEVASSAIPVRGSERLYLQAVRAVAASPDATGVKLAVETGVAGLENISTKLLTLHRVMDSVNTVGVFSAHMDGALEAAGVEGGLVGVVRQHEALIKRLEREHGPDWASQPATYEGEFLQSPDNLQAKITPDIMQRVVDKTMEYMSRERPNPEASTFQKAAHGLLTSINNSPALAVIPVPGLQYSVMKFLWDSSAGGLSILSKTERAAMARGESLAISRAMVGTGIAVAAVAATQHWGTGAGKTDEWYKLAVPGLKGKTLDVRPIAHLAAFFYVGHLLNKAKGDRSWTDLAEGIKTEKNELYKPPPFEEVAKVALNANLRAGSGLALIDNWFSSFGPEGMNWDSAKQAGASTAGTLAANFLTPLAPLVDLYAQYDAYARDTKQSPFFGPILQKVPGGKSTLPLKYTGLREGPPEAPAPFLHSFGGQDIGEAPNLLELEIQRAMLTPNQVFPRHTGDPEADNLVKQQMGKVVQEDILPLLSDEPYKSLDPYRKGLMLQALLTGARKRALAYAASESPKVFETLVKRKPRNLWVRLLQGEEEREEAAAPPGPPGPPEEPPA